MEDLRTSIDPRALGDIFVRRKWFFLLPLVVTIVAAHFVIDAMPEVFRVQSTVLYEGRNPLANQIEGKLLPGSRESGRRNREVENAEANLLRRKIMSDELLAKIGDRMGLYDERLLQAAEWRKAETGDPESVEDLARTILASRMRRLTSINISGSGLYEIVTTGEDPQLLYELNTHINDMLGEIIREEELSRIRATSKFTDEQIALYLGRTEAAKRELRAFLASQAELEQQSPTIDINPAAAARLAEETGFEIVQMNDRLALSRSELAQSYSLDASQYRGGLPRTVSLIEDKLQGLEKQLGYLLLERQWSDPTVIAQNRKIGETRDDILRNIKQHLSTVMADRSTYAQQLMAETLRDEIALDALRIRQRTATAQSVGVSGESATVSLARQERLDVLQEQVSQNEELLRSFMSHKAATSITEAIEQDDQIQSIRVLEPPRWPSNPILPNRPQNYAIAVLLGLTLGGVLMILREYLDTSIRNVNEAEDLIGAPILGTIPKIEMNYLPGSPGRIRRSVVFAVLGVIIAGVAVGYYLTFMG
ncbi:MAG: hypothetical protein HKN20_01610 [Gemmatimonadetes bacterium]|nr:hypothetical protein [Gemmatimonadota bacterium]